MKLFKFAVMLFTALLVNSFSAEAQRTIHDETVITISGINYTGIGEVWGTYTMKTSIRLSKDGYIENLHATFTDSDLKTTEGDKVMIVGTINDNLGILWQFINYPNTSNAGYNIEYDVDDGWLDCYMPPADEWPSEGHFVMLSAKLICKGNIYHFLGMIQIHYNAQGELTVYLTKYW